MAPELPPAHSHFKQNLDIDLVSAAFAVPGVTANSLRLSTAERPATSTRSPPHPRRSSSSANDAPADSDAAPAYPRSHTARKIRLPPDVIASAAAAEAYAAALSASLDSNAALKPPAGLRGIPAVAHPAPRPEPDAQDNTDSYNKVRQLIFNQALKYNVTKAEQKTVNFNDVAEIDSGELLETHVNFDLAYGLGEGDSFRIVMLVIVLMQAINIMLQTDDSLVLITSYNVGFDIFEFFDRAFMGLFAMEIAFKWFYNFPKFWRQWWNLFDLVILIIELCEPPIKALSHIGILRLFRILKPFKSHRTAPFLIGIQVVVQAIGDSTADMANITVLLIIITYIWAIVGVTLYGEVLPIDFGSIEKAFFTLFVTLTQIGWMEPFDQLELKGYFVSASIYFATYLVIGAFVFMKIIVAVVVANLEEAYKLLGEQKKSQHRRLKSIRAVVQAIDHATRETTNMPQRSHSVWKSQIPYELPNFDNLSKEKFKKYILVLAILEDNMAEYMRLKEDLKRIQVDVKTLNQKMQESEKDHDGSGEQLNVDGVGDSDDDDKLDQGEFNGDVLSRILRSQK